tara:strand:+ start:183 stop:1052 length:870 start_codon:yes stop_codon:yes gene_type:complete
MIISRSKIWEEIGVVNNAKFEFKYVGKDKDIPILIANDYLKFPDQVKDFFVNGDWWDNQCKQDIRPGKSYLIHHDLVDWFGEPFAKSIAPLLGLKYLKTDVTFGNNFNGNMSLYNIKSAFPHFDIVSSAAISSDSQYVNASHIAFNINITQSEYPVSTGFYSFNGIKSFLDFSWNTSKEENDFFDNLGHQENDRLSWFQIDDYGPWVLEDRVDMMYNSLVAYPTHFFHSPYIKPDWFTDTDRITISSFLNTMPDNLDFKQQDLDDVSYAWEFFHLDKIHGFHPKKTIPM